MHWKCPRRTCTAVTQPYLTQLYPPAARTVTFAKQVSNSGWIFFLKSAMDLIAVNHVRAYMRLIKHGEPCASPRDLYIHTSYLKLSQSFSLKYLLLCFPKTLKFYVKILELLFCICCRKKPIWKHCSNKEDLDYISSVFIYVNPNWLDYYCN